MKTFGSLFAGIGGIDLGLERAGFACKWQVEIDPFCRKILSKHWPNITRYEDVRYVGKHNLEPVDLVAGGFPCQDVSLAGKRAGLDGKRSTLWSEYARIISEIRPEWVLAENVLGLLSSDDGRFFGNVLRDLASLGYDAEWDDIPAEIFGAPHRRERIFIVAHDNSKRGDSFHWWANTENRDMGNYFQVGAFSNWNGIRIKRQTEEYKTSDALPPRVCRVDDGIPDRVDRVRTLGNAVVPQVAEWIGNRIMGAA